MDIGNHIKVDIGNRINRLLFENQMEQKDLAEALNCTQATMSRWVKGTRTPNSKVLCAIADYFDVSVDWLLGRSEYRNYNGFTSGNDAPEYCEKAKEKFDDCYHIIFDLNKFTLVVSKDKASLFRKDVTKITTEIGPFYSRYKGRIE